jgi:hypothetical protein
MYCAMEIGYFLAIFIKLDQIYTTKFKLVKFKSRNTTNYTLKQDFKNEINWTQYIIPFEIIR